MSTDRLARAAESIRADLDHVARALAVLQEAAESSGDTARATGAASALSSAMSARDALRTFSRNRVLP